MSKPEIWVIEERDDYHWDAMQSEGFFYSEEDAFRAMYRASKNSNFPLRVKCYVRKGTK